MIMIAIMAADMENMIAGSSMTTAAPTLVWKKPMAASQPLQEERNKITEYFIQYGESVIDPNYL